MEKRPLISIIMPVFNSEKVLEQALVSIKNQQHKDVELIIVDGGSTDGTSLIFERYKSIITILIQEPDNGIYDAMNKGVKRASGKWLYFMGADDRLLPGFSEMARQLTDANTLYYGDAEAEGYMLKGTFTKYRLAKYSINHQTIFYPAKVFEKHTYNLRYKVFADYALNLIVWGDATIRKKYIPVKIVRYDLTGFSASNKDDLFKKEKPLIIRKSMGWLMYLRFLYKRNKEQRKTDSNFF
ncbi:glycosyltransferase [Mucilaginibacter sp. 21P]|uniref:glycosyltransferase family 2 protein n=1 Tax=Mucilaginibacter sp. 21P TaxID=2778902 RepID=UPI001C57E15F|nr:glycosyltransferase family 2 protein [Mucilaginibacter sp. 21P]QXV65790.1 glycosyltransferase [Mucilaginibacter sp. 21P]